MCSQVATVLPPQLLARNVVSPHELANRVAFVSKPGAYLNQRQPLIPVGAAHRFWVWLRCLTAGYLQSIALLIPAQRVKRNPKPRGHLRVRKPLGKQRFQFLWRGHGWP